MDALPDEPMKACCKCETEKPTSAFELLPSGNLKASCKDCKIAARREAEFRAKMRAHDRDQERRDDLWSAMVTGRAARAVNSLSYEPTALRRMKVKESFGGGYISVAELACRCSEREAVSRATRACKTPEEHARAMRMLEVGLPSFQRRKALQAFLRGPSAPDLVGPSDSNADPFAAAFNNWAPRGAPSTVDDGNSGISQPELRSASIMNEDRKGSSSSPADHRVPCESPPF